MFLRVLFSILARDFHVIQTKQYCLAISLTYVQYEQQNTVQGPVVGSPFSLNGG